MTVFGAADAFPFEAGDGGRVAAAAGGVGRCDATPELAGVVVATADGASALGDRGDFAGDAGFPAMPPRETREDLDVVFLGTIFDSERTTGASPDR